MLQTVYLPFQVVPLGLQHLRLLKGLEIIVGQVQVDHYLLVILILSCKARLGLQDPDLLIDISSHLLEIFLLLRSAQGVDIPIDQHFCIIFSFHVCSPDFLSLYSLSHPLRRSQKLFLTDFLIVS